VIVSVIVRKKVNINMCLILNVTEIELFESPDLTVLNFVYVVG